MRVVRHFVRWARAEEDMVASYRPDPMLAAEHRARSQVYWIYALEALLEVLR